MTDALDDEDREESWSLAISSLRRSCSVIPKLPPRPFPSPGRPGADRVGFGIDLEMSRPMGFLRLILDLGPPKGDIPGDAVGVVALDEGDKDGMALGGAASREVSSGGSVPSAIFARLVLIYGG